MDEDYNYLIEKYKNYELEDGLSSLKESNKVLYDDKFYLNNENLNLKKENHKLFKENQHFKSTKAYKIWRKYALLKDKLFSNRNNKEISNKNDFNINSNYKPVKNLKKIKVAIIADQFTYDSFKYEFEAILINPNDWEEKFKFFQPDLFFCESTWQGIGTKENKEPWFNKVIKLYNIDGENRKELLRILNYCKDNKIPSIFWNKEDPIHYRTDDWSFADTASKFDYIFTSSEESIDSYKKDYNHNNVYSLMFAAQPKLFNPLNLSRETIKYPVFAGTYYGDSHPERTKLMNMIFDKIIEQWGNLIIFDRNYYRKLFAYPEKYQKYVHPAIEYEKTASLYKKMKWGLNFNIVTESNTMFARRIYELAITNTLILSNYSKAVERLFGDNIFFFDNIQKLPDINGSYEEKRMNNLYNVLKNHTYTERFKQILDTIGYPYIEDKNDITVIFKLDSLKKLEVSIDLYNKIDYSNKKLNIVFNDKSIDITNLKLKYPEIDDVSIENNDFHDYFNNISTEFLIILDKEIGSDFISKGILHYKYLNKRVSISEGLNKFTLGIENDINNKIINKINYPNLYENSSIDVYYI